MPIFPNFNRIELSEEQIVFYRENGFIQVDNVINSEEVEELRMYMEESMSTEVKGGKTEHKNRNKQDGGYSRVLNQVVNLWRDHGGVGKYSFHARFADLAKQLAGKPMRIFHDHALWKMPHDSRPTPWHQDFPFWPMTDSGLDSLSIWIALDDVDETNGAMMFIPKSHFAGKFDMVPLNNPINLFDHVKDPKLKETRPVLCKMKAGSVTFHHGLTFHYANANITDKPRRAFAVIYMPDGTIFNGKNHIVTDPMQWSEGQRMTGGLFPLLTDEVI